MLESAPLEPETSGTDVALKEWQSIGAAALNGRVALLVRKGGILEQRTGFSAEHRAFWLYPTFLHQNPGELRPEFTSLQGDDPEPGSVRLEAFCRVEAVWKVESLEVTRSLEPFNALGSDALERRFLYRDKPWVHALLLRVWRTEPQVIAETPGYAGCSSWVPLERAVIPVNATPAMSDPEFAALKTRLEAMLG